MTETPPVPAEVPTPALPAPGWSFRVAHAIRELWSRMPLLAGLGTPQSPVGAEINATHLRITRRAARVEGSPFEVALLDALPEILAIADAERIPVETTSTMLDIRDHPEAALRSALRASGFVLRGRMPSYVRPPLGRGDLGLRRLSDGAPLVVVLAGQPELCMAEIPPETMPWPVLRRALSGIAQQHGCRIRDVFAFDPVDPLSLASPLRAAAAFEGADDALLKFWLYRWQGDGFVCTRPGTMRPTTPAPRPPQIG